MVQVAPAQMCRLPAPSLKIVSTSLVALNPASRVEAVVLVKSEVVTAVPWRAKVLAVTVPAMGKVSPKMLVRWAGTAPSSAPPITTTAPL